MRDKKELIGISVVLGVIWSTYIVVATLLKQNHDITFWICCGFVSIATVIQIIDTSDEFKGLFF